jgi:hypothetical protein
MRWSSIIIGQPIDYFLIAWFALAGLSTAYVAYDQFRNNPEPKVMKWGFLLVTLYMGPIGLLLYVMANKEPHPGTHENFIKPLWKQGVGSTIRCVAVRPCRSERRARTARGWLITASPPLMSVVPARKCDTRGRLRDDCLLKQTTALCYSLVVFEGPSAASGSPFTSSWSLSMATKKDIHVVPHPDGWATKKEGNDRAGRVEDTQRAAIERARDQAKREGVEVVIHKRDGSIRDSDSYGNDPNPPKDRKH